MALAITLAQNAAATHPDLVSIKCIEISYPMKRPVIVTPMPGGSLLALDFGRYQQEIVLDCVVDEDLEELFVDTIAGGPFVVGETITGTAGWNATVTPVRGATPTAIVLGGLPNLTAPTTLIISSLGHGDNNFFVDNEQITGGTSFATALVNKPLAHLHRWEQISRYFYVSGNMTLTTSNAAYIVQITSIQPTRQSGTHPFYVTKIGLIKVA